MSGKKTESKRLSYFVIAAVTVSAMMLPCAANAHKKDVETTERIEQPVERRSAERRVLDMNSCVSCHQETYSIGQLLEISGKKKNEAWKCGGRVEEVVERSRHLRGALKRVESASLSVFGDMYKYYGEGVIEFGDSPESEIARAIFEKDSALRESYENHLLTIVENVDAGKKENEKIRSETVEIYAEVNEVFLQRRLRNIFILVAISCLVFIFSVIIGYGRMLSGESGETDEKGEQDGE